MNSRTREGFYTLWTLAIFVCLAACIFVLAWVSFTDGGDTAALPPAGEQSQQDVSQDGTVQPQDGTQQDGTQPQAALPGEGMTGEDITQAVQDAAQQNAVELPQTQDMGSDYQNRLIFLGDSTTYGLYSYGILPHYQVWTPSSGTMSLFNWAAETIEYYAPGDPANAQNIAIIDCAAYSQPEYVVITLGLNGIALLDEQQFKDYYTGLIQAIQQASPNTRIICNSIYPVIDEKTSSEITNAKINAANGWIKDVAAATNCRYLNSHDELMDETGQLPAQYEGGDDGIHMNADGYNAVLQIVRTHAWQ